jgi:GT2 family glycosyltransferase
MSPEITIIIPTRNRVGILEVSLGYLHAATQGVHAEIIVVNDGDEEVYRLKKTYPSIRIVDNPGSGVASARNTGAAKATSDLLLFMDDDIWMTAEALKRMHEFHAEAKMAVLNVNWIYPQLLEQQLKTTAFGRYLSRHQFTSLKGWNKDQKDWRDDECFKTQGVTSQNLSMRKEVFDRIGGYTEKFPHAGFEDHDFSKALLKHGVEIYIDPRAMTFHNEADRVELIPWMNRRQRGGETRRVAVDLGYVELQLNYSKTRATLLSFISAIRPLLSVLSSNRITNAVVALDFFSFKIFDALFAAAIYKGYTHKDS